VGSRDYSDTTKKALFALSFGRCYFPDCANRVVEMAGETPIVTAQIAHIRAAKKGGPRYDENMTDEERRSFSNLLVLCTFHHRLIDTKPTGDNYPAELLQEWKEQHEGQLSKDLAALTEEDLTEFLNSTLEELIAETKSELLAAIEKVEAISRESAELLRTLVNKTFSSPAIDPDTVAVLAESTQAFNNLPDYAPVLLESSRRFDHLQDCASMLHAFSRGLEHLQDYASMLHAFSRGLEHLPDYASMLHESAQGLLNLPDYAPMLQETTHDLKNAVAEMKQTIQRAERLETSSYFSTINTATSKMESISDDITESIQGLRAISAAPLGTRPPDRWTYIRNGMIAGAAIATLLMSTIWYLVAH